MQHFPPKKSQLKSHFVRSELSNPDAAFPGSDSWNLGIPMPWPRIFQQLRNLVSGFCLQKKETCLPAGLWICPNSSTSSACYPRDTNGGVDPKLPRLDLRARFAPRLEVTFVKPTKSTHILGWTNCILVPSTRYDPHARNATVRCILQLSLEGFS
jgi:hypothetical protein